MYDYDSDEEERYRRDKEERDYEESEIIREARRIVDEENEKLWEKWILDKEKELCNNCNERKVKMKKCIVCKIPKIPLCIKCNTEKYNDFCEKCYTENNTVVTVNNILPSNKERYFDMDGNEI
jgi:hypothetical protein